VKTAVKKVDKLVEMKVELRVGSLGNWKAEKLVGKKVVELDELMVHLLVVEMVAKMVELKVD
jgi:hypothetical protein